MADFYLTLLSNSSMQYYPDNKTGNFTVQLPKALTLEGIWKVAVTDVHYQYNLLNVSPENNGITFRMQGENGQCNIFDGFYEKIEDLLGAINTFMDPFINQKGEHFLQINDSKQVNVNTKAYKVMSRIQFKNRLALQLGFEPNVTIRHDPHRLKIPANVSKGIPDEMFIYCDIAEPQYFGHELSRILKMVTIPKHIEMYGQTVHKEFQRLQYISVMKKHFETITIELRDKTGAYLPFVSGTFMIVLHFRKFE
jgi:hypothetical protein